MHNGNVKVNSLLKHHIHFFFISTETGTLTFNTNILCNVFSSASPIAGFLDDYAFVVCGLLDLFEATQKVRWLEWAEELQQRQDQLFWDSQGSGYFCSDPSDPTLLLSLKQGKALLK